MSNKSLRVGSIYGDLTLVASDVQRACARTSLVWADDVGDVFASPTSDAHVRPHSIVGIFTFGASVDDIRDDLQAMRRDRARHWIVDSV
jgi:hypothetical protein